MFGHTSAQTAYLNNIENEKKQRKNISAHSNRFSFYNRNGSSVYVRGKNQRNKLLTTLNNGKTSISNLWQDIEN